MKTLSRKTANILFGRYGSLEGELSIISAITHPDGLKIEWPGNDGLIVTLVRRIIALEDKVKELSQKPQSGLKK